MITFRTYQILKLLHKQISQRIAKTSKGWSERWSYEDDLNEMISEIIHIDHPMDHLKRNFSEHWDDLRDHLYWSFHVSSLRSSQCSEKLRLRWSIGWYQISSHWDHLHKTISEVIHWMLPWTRVSNPLWSAKNQFFLPDVRDSVFAIICMLQNINHKIHRGDIFVNKKRSTLSMEKLVVFLNF